jgi:vacuolar protein sorting-associated protein 45
MNTIPQKQKVTLHDISDNYLHSMLSNVKDMKAIILDNETQVIFSLEFSKSVALKEEIFLFENIEKITPDQKFNLSGVFFLRPTETNLKYLKKILENLNFKEIHLFFTNEISEDMLYKLAQYDSNTQIKTIQEVYLDYYIINSNVFHFNIDSCISNLAMTPEDKWTRYDDMMFQRIFDGIIAVCLSNRLFPIIKCVKGSWICNKLGMKLAEYFKTQIQSDFFRKEWAKGQNGVLFLFDRKEDPVTPLINQWTYQAMLHEIFGIENNVINYKEEGKKEEKFVISDKASEDSFFASQMNNDYGKVANEVEQAAERLKRENAQMDKETSLEQIRKMVDTLQEKKKESTVITKHYKLFFQLSEYVSSHKLMDLSKIEQDISCHNNKKEQLKLITEIIQDNKISTLDKAKLYLLYILRYEGDNTIQTLKNVMKENSMQEWIEYGDWLIEYAGKNKRQYDVLSTKSVISMGKKILMNAFGNDSNVLMQHVSYINELIEMMLKGKLKEDDIYTVYRSLSGNPIKPEMVVVFNFGGITYEETKDLSTLSDQYQIKIISGGTTILNSKKFLAELRMLKSKTTEDTYLNVK